MLICLFFYSLIFLSGCSIFSNKKFLVPPECTNEEHAIYNTLENSSYLKSKIFLEIPKNSDKTSAITYLNNKKLAVLCYNTKERNNLKMAVFSKKSGNWKYIFDIPLKGTKLDIISSTKNENEKTEFLAVGTIKNNEKIYTLYNIEEENLKEIYSFNYRFLAFLDINGDGNKKLVTFSNVAQGFKEQEYKVSIEEKIKKHMQSYENLINNSTNDPKIKRKIEEERKNTIHYIFLVNSLTKDGIKIEDFKGNFDEDYVDDVNFSDYKLDNKTLGEPCLFLVMNEKSLSQEICRIIILNFKKDNSKIYRIDTRGFGKSINDKLIDVNNDGKLEFPTLYNFPGYNSLNRYSKITDSCKDPLVTFWYNLSNENFKIPFSGVNIFCTVPNAEYGYTYTNFANKYGLKLPERWRNKVTAKYKNASGDIDFFVYENSLEKDSKKLLSIKLEHKNAQEQNKPEDGFFILHEKDGIICFAKIYDKIDENYKDLKLTKEELKKMFFTFN